VRGPSHTTETCRLRIHALESPSNDLASARAHLCRGRELMTTIKELHGEIEADWEAELGHRRYQTLRSALRDIAEKHPNAADG
jgi:hypothetical protein